jgi:succinate dehydrogenase/fumarate reductase flavoprotein subunit
VIDRLLGNRIDLTRDCIEVSPIAHYHMGGIRVGVEMQSSVPGLFAAGEAVGGANGANRLSGNAIPEAFVFGHKAGVSAATHARKSGARAFSYASAAGALDLLKSDAGTEEETGPAAMLALQQVMGKYAGPLRTESGLLAGLAEIARLETTVSPRPPPATRFAAARRDWFDLRNMLLVARTIACAALSRRESRGAHQREDCPSTDSRWDLNQTLQLRRGELVLKSQSLRPRLFETA